jgi:hypothetical protein
MRERFKVIRGTDETALERVVFARSQSVESNEGDFVTVWAGPGHGKACRKCGRSIDFSDVECEVELRDGQNVTAFKFHAQCYSAWFYEYQAPP